MTRIIDVVDLEHGETSYEFEGYHHGYTNVSFIVRRQTPATQARGHFGRVFTRSAGQILLRVRPMGA